MVPSVVATDDGKWIGNFTVTVNTSNYAVIEGTQYQWNHFFGILDAAGLTPYAWVNDGTYSDRKYLEHLTYNNVAYPATVNTNDAYEWKIVDSLDADAYLYKKGLAGRADAGTNQDFYLWYGDRESATGTYNDHTSWLFPTEESYFIYFFLILVYYDSRI